MFFKCPLHRRGGWRCIYGWNATACFIAGHRQRQLDKL